MFVKGGSTDVITYYKMRRAADGTAATGLTPADFDLQYTRSGAAAAAKVDATLNANGVGGAHSPSTVIEVDATSSPGKYRIDWVDAAFAAGVREVTLDVKVATAFSESLRVEIDTPVDAIAISGDQAAADSLELQYDGTGLAGDTFPATQSQLAGIANVGSAVNDIASSYTLTTGTQSSGTVTSTNALDGTNHEHTDVAGAMDLYYEFSIGGGIPSAVTITGYLNGNNDNLEVSGYDWVAAGWVQIGTLNGKNASTNEVDSYNMFVNMVGSGANEGLVRVRFSNGVFTLTSATLAIDQIFASFSLGSEGYEGGAIWIDTTISNTNTVVGIDGTARNPVSTMAAANTLAASANLNRFQIAPGSSITLAASQDDQSFIGHDWTLALGGQSISSSYIEGAKVSGTATGASPPTFVECTMNACTLDECEFRRCGFANTITASAAGSYHLNACFSEIAGAASPTFDFGTAIGNTSLNMRHYSGGITIESMGNTGTDTMSLEGHGQFTEGTCTGGTVEIRGHFTVSGISNLTLSDDARFDSVQLVDDNWDEVLTGATHNVVNSAGRRLRQIQEAGGYSGGAIYIDTVNGVAGTTNFENGVDSNPVDSIADANTIAASLGISTFVIAPGSSITLAASQNNQAFTGSDGWTLALGGQDIAGSTFRGATVSGVASGTGTTQRFIDCMMGAISHIANTHVLTCGITGTQTLVEAGDVFFDRCHSGMAGVGTPVVNFGAAIGNSNVNIRNYSGGIQFEGMGDTGTDTAVVEGRGQFIEGTCTGGTVAIRGHFEISGITNLTLSDDARIDVAQINAEADTAISDAFTFTVAGQVDANSLSIASSGPAATALSEGARMVEPVTFTAVAATTTTATLATVDGAAPSSQDDQYKDAVLIFTGGTPDLAKVRTDITAYNGTTKVVTFTAIPVAVDATTTANMV